MSAPLGELRAATLRLGGRAVLADVSLALGRGECVGLVGPNGAGKTSLMRALLGLARIEGEARLAGRPVAAMRARDRARAASFLPQSREVAWALPVEDLVALGRLPARRPGAAPAEADRAAVEDAIRRLDLEPLRRRRATGLSGGELARALIARALAQDAPLLLADEPAAGLDPEHQIAVMEILGEAARAGRGVLVSLHDLGLAARWCGRIVMMSGGRIVADAPPREALTRERLREVFRVDAEISETAHGLAVQPWRRIAG